MSKISDERLESLLENYYRAEPDDTPAVSAVKADKAPLPLTARYRALSLAASLILVSLIGVTVFILFHKSAAPVAQPSQNDIYDTQPGSEYTALTPTKEPETHGAETRGTETRSAETQNTETQSTETRGAETDAAGTPYPASVNERSDASESGHIHSARQKPAESYSSDRPTEAPYLSTEAPTQAQSPTEPAEQPTSAHDEEPTYRPLPPNYYERELAETSKWVNYLAHQTISGTAQRSTLTGEGRVYFRIYAFDGTPLGDEELFSESNLAQVRDNVYDTVTVSYYLGGLEDDLSRIREGDMLTCRFCNEDGEVIYARIIIF